MNDFRFVSLQRRALLLTFGLLTCAIAAALGADVEQRFPPPDLGLDYVYPTSAQGEPRVGWMAWVDLAVLFIGLSLAAFFALRLRSRRGLFYLSIASVLYLGFYRKGCVCAIGSIQNIAQALFDSSYVVPWTVIGFFALPLIFALLFGRVFCAGVCPLGALQDLVLLRPVRVSRALDWGLSIGRYFYLALAILYAASGAAYIICQYDPFVAFFRMSARLHIWLLSALLLGLSLFVGRPYCRWLCPYGALLGLLSRFSVRRATITPAECVTCGLCADACPFGSIQEGDTVKEEEPPPGAARRRMLQGLAMLVVLALVGLAAGRQAGPGLSRLHYMIQAAERLYEEESQNLRHETLQTRSIRATGIPSEQIYAQAREIRSRFRFGGGLFGMFFALAAGLKIISIRARRSRSDYIAEGAHCLACARCYDSCPIEHKRRKQLPQGGKAARHA